ncbi:MULTISPECIES: RES family NAD+ phosphorylase [unclassified Thioalkalivibrio]|uniref:RES family NAD+ phosphorylase n=1 Tax=unclassified Thioalkalivibrio TaxID=2621013 RepID=UPI001E2ED789|nr:MULTISPECIES: RES family NAD+ phosphorylase [unclassified Thioalkalivibrio]
MWTHTALASEAAPANGEGWRVVEHQYTVSTRKLVSTRDEQEVLEAILEETKPAFPANTAHLHYLLKTPFRYPPSPFGSRFRRPQEGEGVFYCAEAVRTGLAEFSYWRRHFFETSPGTPLPEAHESLTVFNVAWRTPSHLDLTRPPLNQDRAQWTHPDDYTATRALAAEARRAGIQAIRYESVRDPQRGANLALLAPAVFTQPEPLTQQTWYLYLGASESNCIRAGRDESFTFPASSSA